MTVSGTKEELEELLTAVMYAKSVTETHPGNEEEIARLSDWEVQIMGELLKYED
jgi:hypothetical protein